MSDATTDPTLATLVPARSRRRNLLVSALAVAALLGAWASPVVLRPSVMPDSYYGTWTPEPTGEVVSSVQITAATWPSVVVSGVRDLPGAEVLQTWAVTGPPSGQTPPPPGGLDAGGAMALPYRLGHGEQAELTIRWRITDCSALVAGTGPEVELRSAAGTRTREELADVAGPAFDLDQLTATGICPGP